MHSSEFFEMISTFITMSIFSGFAAPLESERMLRWYKYNVTQWYRSFYTQERMAKAMQESRHMSRAAAGNAEISPHVKGRWRWRCGAPGASSGQPSLLFAVNNTARAYSRSESVLLHAFCKMHLDTMS